MRPSKSPGLGPRKARHLAKAQQAVQRKSDPIFRVRAAPGNAPAAAQFRSLSTSLFLPIQGIIARSLAPTSSIGWALARARIALKEVWLTRFSSIQSRVNLPDWMSSRTRFISTLVAPVMMRGPETYSPYSAVLEIE